MATHPRPPRRVERRASRIGSGRWPLAILGLSLIGGLVEASATTMPLTTEPSVSPVDTAGVPTTSSAPEMPAISRGEWAPISAAPIEARLDPVIGATSSELLVWGGRHAAAGGAVSGAAFDVQHRRWRIIERPR